jgi:hypothetical protein
MYRVGKPRGQGKSIKKMRPATLETSCNGRVMAQRNRIFTIIALAAG